MTNLDRADDVLDALDALNTVMNRTRHRDGAKDVALAGLEADEGLPSR